MRTKKLGNIVKTKTGKSGRVYRGEKKVRGKVVVHLDNEEIPMLCDPQTITIIGKFD